LIKNDEEEEEFIFRWQQKAFSEVRTTCNYGYLWFMDTDGGT